MTILQTPNRGCVDLTTRRTQKPQPRLGLEHFTNFGPPSSREARQPLWAESHNRFAVQEKLKSLSDSQTLHYQLPQVLGGHHAA